MRAAAARRYPDDVPASLDAHIRIVHGAELLADSSDGEEAMCDRFEGWVRAHYPASRDRRCGRVRYDRAHGSRRHRRSPAPLD